MIPLMSDPIFNLIFQEEQRQKTTLQLIPSENICSVNVRRAVESILSNKYSEGYPHKRYYEGNELIDEIELLAIERAKKIFGVPHANVQPYSGSPANVAIQLAILEKNDCMMGMKLSSGGHLTHGHPQITFAGKMFQTIQYGLNAEARIDLDEVRRLAHEHRPKLMIIGTTAYPFQLPFKEFFEIAQESGAYVLADISHVSGLVIGGVHPSPVEFAHIIMTTTHKTLRGPRGAMIMVTNRGLEKDPQLAEKIDKAVFPGVQGGPHNNVTAGIAVALEEASTIEFEQYAEQVVKNAKRLATALLTRDVKLVGNGTENHLMILDFSHFGGGTQVAYAMACAGLYANKNTVPNEPNSPFYPSGVRIGTPHMTSIGLVEHDMEKVADWIVRVVRVAERYVLPTEKTERSPFLKKMREEMKADFDLQMIRAEIALFLKEKSVWK